MELSRSTPRRSATRASAILEPLEPRQLFAALAPAKLDPRIININFNGGPIESRFIADSDSFVIVAPDGATLSLGTFVYEVIDENDALITYLEEPSHDPDDAVRFFLQFTSADGGTIASTLGGAPEATFAFGSAALIDDALLVVGSPFNDAMSITRSGSDLNVTRNGVSETHPLAGVTHLGASLGDGNDSLTVGTGVMGIFVTGDAGNDTLLGGDGNDSLNGNSGSDRINAGPGDDRVSGNGSRDYLTGGLGNDRIYGGDANDVLSGLSNVDRLYGGDGDDNINGGTSSDKLYGEDGNDTLGGASGDDLLDGGAGNDIIDGGIGNDIYRGQAGLDTLFSRDGVAESVDGGDDDDAARADLEDLQFSVETQI